MEPLYKVMREHILKENAYWLRITSGEKKKVNIKLKSLVTVESSRA